MSRFQPTDLNALERAQASPAALNQGLWAVLSNSLVTKAKVDSFNLETGEYRVVLQGTLDLVEEKSEKL